VAPNCCILNVLFACSVVKDLLNFSQFMEFWAGKGCSREECLPVGGMIN
jgi:hypothetical protein